MMSFLSPPPLSDDKAIFLTLTIVLFSASLIALHITGVMIITKPMGGLILLLLFIAAFVIGTINTQPDKINPSSSKVTDL